MAVVAPFNTTSPDGLFLMQLEGLKSSGGADEKKDEVTHIGMFRRQLAKSFGHLRSRSNPGPAMDASAAGERSQNDLSSDASSAGIYRDASAQNLAEGPVTDNNLATGPNPETTAAKLKVGAPHSDRDRSLWMDHLSTAVANYALLWAE